jgi:hypothetical protein
MLTTVLFQILLIVLIVAGALLIANFWRWYGILGDLKSVSEIVSRRVKEADLAVENIKTIIRGWRETVTGFVYSLGFVKTLRRLFENNKKGDEDGE